MDDRVLLEQLIAGPATGDALARHAGLTRAAVWKRIEALREAGVPIEAKPGRGYVLAAPMQLLAADAIEADLSPATRARLAALEVAWSVDSTNTRLLARDVPDDGLALALLAERQTGGRGRRGRMWTSPLGAHVYLSLARGFAGGLGRLGGLSLVAGIATVEALHAMGAKAVRLKWPNDLVVVADDGLRKLGGLLVEGGGEHAGPARAVLGLGINVRMPAAQAVLIDQPWCDLATLLGAVDRNAVAATVLDRLVPALDQFDAEGLAPFLPRYAALDVLAGQPVTLIAPGGTREAIALGLADDGALRVRLSDGLETRVHSGEVSVRRVVAP
ncbi:biotin--protein ligase [Lysobacter daejeonensis GH1-9]|uniref:Bifunctional ligase/repressor BirA n=1 Tax=Lysobacter daejeonensis GH1-9 TaxID=1385517 RepID=A0A0A0ERR2_9GAMM|nr:bifunctional biotin--[acetyl-CoA-carboxylase] ligase/biotin operon repressor BirA [Lysobacter daejeonensis]KGM53676.1 biotin--protein ligase [Lysobacter daejeonensis GH1-9]